MSLLFLQIQEDFSSLYMPEIAWLLLLAIARRVLEVVGRASPHPAEEALEVLTWSLVGADERKPAGTGHGLDGHVEQELQEQQLVPSGQLWPD